MYSTIRITGEFRYERRGNRWRKLDRKGFVKKAKINTRVQIG